MAYDHMLEITEGLHGKEKNKAVYMLYVWIKFNKII